ncbi:hypothetical protein N781_16695 [Pontibacillus halophilus JSM 076056 = DSM 19796]|uniref:DUF6449 domain-containing protein n=1 Tax=Pontibacillus halophilus JSM 076056 = DSM 19796 TaxID=1385510 RepID=A0A0A5GMS4_9BACI|nr:DUF6449 domain-containing protein [Pontibacillus halophilus]KGX92498.1 hypothetical protein N781_16695 [Pontibacillus halophilus JSM 076056 = DSM 19796]
MPSITSSFKKELWKQNLRSVGWIGALYLIALIFILPLTIFMTLQDSSAYFDYYSDGLFSGPLVLQYPLIVGVPVVLAVFLFRYLHVTSASDFIHSLPMSRKSLFHHYLLFGITLLAIPLLITALILLIMSGVMDVSFIFDSGDLAYWFFISLLMTTLFYVVGIFIGMLTGISLIQGILTFILLVFPFGITVLVALNLDIYLVGFSVDYLLTERYTYLSPVTDLANVTLRREGYIWHVAIYAILIFVFYGASYVAYKVRKLEEASNSIAFPILRQVFKYGVTACFTLLGGFYFGAIMGYDVGWAIIGYVIGAIIGYILAEITLQKTWRIRPHVKGFVFFVVVASGVLYVSFQDGFGYADRVPEFEEVEEVYFGDYLHYYYEYLSLEGENELNSREHSHYYSEGSGMFQSKESIEQITNLHKAIVNNKDALQTYDQQARTVSIVYELKDGSKMVRKYERVAFQPLHQSFRPIYESNAFLEKEFPILTKSADEFDRLNLQSYLTDKRVNIVEESQLQQGLDALKKDIQSLSYEEMLSLTDSGLNMEFLISEPDSNEPEYIQMTYYEEYEEFTKWMKENGNYDSIKVTVDDVREVEIGYLQEGFRETQVNDFMNGNYQSIEGLEQSTVTDQEAIEWLMEHQQTARSEFSEPTMMMQFSYKGQNERSYSLSREDAETFRETFNQ